MRFGVWGLGFGVWGLGFGVWGLGFGFDAAAAYSTCDDSRAQAVPAHVASKIVALGADEETLEFVKG